MPEIFFDESPTIGCPECGKESFEGVSKYCRDHYRDNWHLWFAWYPVKTNSGIWVWLTRVYRKPIPKDYQMTGSRGQFGHWYSDVN